MRQIAFSDVGVVANSMEDIVEIYLTYTALDIPFSDTFEEDCKDAQHNLTGWYIQSTSGILTTNPDEDELHLSLINYQINYVMDSLDFAIACQLLMSNQEDELLAHLNKYCKEYSHV